ncbi:terminase [Serratia fonticola]|uniref:phage terminase small subunit n=1 Tax=Serratia fonticola TaxID=47917 RepID=UPI0015C68E63|nr:phage terminase small subunit [Serratia fonticola]NXZ86284.1 terminase [Serratia fonticola]
MTFNPLRYRSQMLAQAKRRPPETEPQAIGDDSLHLQLLGLERDVKRLRELPRIADRIEMKRSELLPRWRPYVERYLAAGEVYPYLVFSYCVIWLFDTGDIDAALDWADIAIAQDQVTPEQIRSRFPAFVADHVLQWAEQQAAAGRSIEPYFSRTFTNIREHWRLHEKISAKWFKFAGEFLLRDKNGQPAATAIEDIPTLKKAYELLAQAEGFHSAIGVSTLRKRIQSRIRALEKQAVAAEIDTAP